MTAQFPISTATHGELRERAIQFGFDSLTDSECLSLTLAGRRGVKCAATLAAKLLKRFLSYPGVIGADLPALISEGVPRGVAVELKVAHQGAVRMALEPVRQRTVITSWTALLAYVRAAMAHETREQFRVLHLDKRNQLIVDEVLNYGTVDHAPVYPREVAKRALETGASAVILVHNHPSGDPAPSSADIDMTRQIIEALKVLKITVHDHLVVGRDGVASFKALGLI
jgi:DNA repair protein RadC